MNTKALEMIGLTKSEIKAYLTLLKLGQTTAGPIVDEAGITRSKIYDILERLKRKGLVSQVFRNSVKYFSATNPKNILEYLEQKEEEIKDEKQNIQNLLPELLVWQSLGMDKKTVEVFLGFKGMENAFNTLAQEFESKETYYAFGAGKGENVKMVQLLFERLHNKRKEKKVKSKIVFNESSRGLFKTQEKSTLVEARYAAHTTPAAINIYKNYTIIAILNEEPITILINSRETADSFKEYFQVIWTSSKI